MKQKEGQKMRKKKNERAECINHYTNKERERHYNRNRRQRNEEIIGEVQP